MSQNKITVSNNRYYDKYINGVWQNPYETKRTFALTTPIAYSRSRDIYFKLPQDLFLSNLDAQIASLQVDVDNGQGYKNLPFDSPVLSQFFENKIHDITYKFTLTNNQVYYCRSKFKIDDPVLESIQKAAIVVDDERVYIHEDGNFFNAAWITIRRRTDSISPGITRPFIIAEGLDTGNFTAPDTFGGESTLGNFNRSLLNSGNLFDILRDGINDYDLIYIDWLRGMADMRDNSRVLEAVLDWVNDQKVLSGSTQPNVLIGQSMGGVIGRYTLARMENENSNHDVRLFIAHDSPMQGANTLLSGQHLSAHMRQIYVNSPLLLVSGEALIPIGYGLAQLGSDYLNYFGANTTVPTFVTPLQLLSLQDRTAARQLNYYSVTSSANGPQRSTDSFHLQWQQQLESVGWPQLSENVAISNGNECSVDNNFEPGDPLLILDSRSNPGFWLDMLNILIAPLTGVALGDPALIVVGLVPGNSRWQTNFDFNSYGYLGSQNRIYRGRVKFEKKVLWIGPTINYDVTNRSYNAPANALPFDTYSGGTFNIASLIDDFPDFITNKLPGLDFPNPRYGFIPVVSALDIKKINGNDPTPDDYLKSYSGGILGDSNLISGFNDFIVDNRPDEPRNNRHITFRPRIGNWLANELNEVAQTNFVDCNFACDLTTTQIEGPEQFCGTATYSLPAGADTYIWSTDSTQVQLVQNGNQVSVTRLNDFDGKVTIQAILNAPNCGVNNKAITKEIHLGAPTFEDYYTIPDQEEAFFCQSQFYSEDNVIEILEVNGIDPALTSNIDWDFDVVSSNFSSYNVKNKLYFVSYVPGPIVFTLSKKRMWLV